MLKYMIHAFKLYHPDLANNIVDCYDNGDDSITVVLNDGRKALFDYLSNGMRYISRSRNELTDHQIANEFRDRLRRRMIAKSVTQEQLSEMTGIPQSSISMYTAGKRLPNLQNAFKISNALKCSIDDLIYKEPK